MPVREVVKELEGRQRELVNEAGTAMALANAQLNQVAAHALQTEKHYRAMLEVVTGEDSKGLLYDMDSGQIFREVGE